MNVLQDHSRKMGVIVGAEIPEAGLSPFYVHTGSGRVLAQLEYCGAVPSLTAGEMGDLARFHEAVFGPDGLAFTPPWMKVAEGEVHSITLQSPPSPWIPTFGGVVFLICGRRKYCVVTELRKA